MKPNGPAEFMAKVSSDANGCWRWQGPRTLSGYGIFSYANGRFGQRAHRIAWVLFRGPIPDGLNVLHRCDIRDCVNPDHLFLGTHADNIADMGEKGRRRTRAGVPQTEQAKRLLREAARQRWQDPQERARIGELSGRGRLGKPRGPYKPRLVKRCPTCGTEFETGGQGNPRRATVYCSRRCQANSPEGRASRAKGSRSRAS